MKIRSWLLGFVGMLSFGFANAAQAQWDGVDDFFDSAGDSVAKSESLNPSTGTWKVDLDNGNITVSDAANSVVINSHRHGAASFSLDDVALVMTSQDVVRATALRFELSQALRPSEGVASRIADINKNGILDEPHVMPPDCNFTMRCTPLARYQDSRGMTYFTTFFERGPPQPAPTETERAIACDKVADWEADFALDLTAAGLACGIAETPPTFALCLLAIGNAARNQKRRSEADKICRDPRPN